MTSTRRKLVEQLRPVRSAGACRAVGLLIFDLSVYGLLWVLLLLAQPWWWKAALALGTGIAIARLFIIGHDACHGSFFPATRWWNAAVGRLVFLPSLTPFSTWELGHNTLHHGFTNLRGKDYVYAPFTRAEFAAMPGWRRRLERIYRHPLGPGLHYAIEVWWKRLWFPPSCDEVAPRARHFRDSMLTLGFLAAQLAVVGAVAPATEQPPGPLVVWAVALPFVVWNALMGFVTYQQHTHPEVTWYADRREWDPVTAQIRGTVHIVFPPPFGMLLGNIMEHTAHHLDVTIPLFNLPVAQRRVEETFPTEVTRVNWSLSYYLDCCRRCKLYDYGKRKWTGFDGVCE